MCVLFVVVVVAACHTEWTCTVQNRWTQSTTIKAFGGAINRPNHSGGHTAKLIVKCNLLSPYSLGTLLTTLQRRRERRKETKSTRHTHTFTKTNKINGAKHLWVIMKAMQWRAVCGMRCKAVQWCARGVLRINWICLVLPSDDGSLLDRERTCMRDSSSFGVTVRDIANCKSSR